MNEDVLQIELDTCHNPGPRMLGISAHAYRLCEFLSNPETFEPTASEWLRLASGLYGIGIDLQAYDQTSYMCGSAFEYYKERSKTASHVVTELTRFLFIWGALEAFIGERPDRGSKVKHIAKLLNAYEAQHPRAVHFDCNAQQIASLISQSDALRQHEGEMPADYGKSIASVFKFIARIRNGFAHGALNLPDAPAWGGSPSLEISVIACAQRIILFVIQMLSIPRYGDASVYSHDLYGDSADVPADEVLPRLHLCAME